MALVNMGWQSLLSDLGAEAYGVRVEACDHVPVQGYACPCDLYDVVADAVRIPRA